MKRRYFWLLIMSLYLKSNNSSEKYYICIKNPMDISFRGPLYYFIHISYISELIQSLRLGALRAIWLINLRAALVANKLQSGISVVLINNYEERVDGLLQDSPMRYRGHYPNSNVQGANMGPTWGQQDPGGPNVGSMNFAIWVSNHCKFPCVP